MKCKSDLIAEAKPMEKLDLPTATHNNAVCKRLKIGDRNAVSFYKPNRECSLDSKLKELKKVSSRKILAVIQPKNYNLHLKANLYS